ncbi:MAG: DUF5666 domain-containing protein [Arenibacterium sp.]
MIFQHISRYVLAIYLVVILGTISVAGDDTEREGGLTGTGIVGEIVALGSIIVNDQRIAFARDLRVANRVAPKSAHDLVPGDVVAVAVVPDANGWVADAISQIHPLIGPVSGVETDRFTLFGVTVFWQGAPPRPGTWVAVSGFWARDDVVATRVERIAEREVFSIQGSYRPSDDGTGIMVGSVKLGMDRLQHAEEGDVITVSGTLAGGKLTVSEVHLGLFDRPVALVMAEGYLTDVAPSGHYTVAGSGLSAYTDKPDAAMTADRIRVCGNHGELVPPQKMTNGAALDRLGCPIGGN